MNLVSLALQYLAPALIGKLASGSGISQTIAEKVIKAAVPVILGSLVGKSSKPDGARALFDVLGKQDTGLLGRLSTILGSPQQKTIAEQGSNVLGSLLGTSSLGSLVGAVSKFSGASESSSSGIIGMLAPIVLGTLSQQQKSSNLDASGVARLLSDQKSNISAAIPSDLSKLLSGSGLLDSVMQKVTGTTTSTTTSSTSNTPARTTSNVPARTSSGYAQPAASSSSGFNGWPWAALVGLASLLWGSWFGGPPAPWAAVPAPPRLMAGSTDVAGELDTVLKSLHGVMSTIKDKKSADDAVPQLKITQATIDRLDVAAKQLPNDGKRILAGHVAQWLPVISPAINGLLGNSTVAPVVKPVLDTMVGRLLGLTKV